MNRDLKSNQPLSGAALREFRQAVDSVRMTAWTVSELLTARLSQKDPQAVVSFFTAERLRRFSQMANDLGSDLARDGATWPPEGVEALKESISLLGERLGQLSLKMDA